MSRGPRDVPSSIQGAPTHHLPGSLISPSPPPVCHPVAAEPSLSNSNHCLCQLTSSGRIRQMWGHQCCPDLDCFLSTVRMWAPSCRFWVPAVCLPVSWPDTLNTDPIWRAQHLNSQETFFLFCFFFFLLTSRECSRAKRETLQTGEDTLWIHLHTLKTLLHASKVLTFTTMETVRMLLWLQSSERRGRRGAVSTWNEWKCKKGAAPASRHYRLWKLLLRYRSVG